MNKRLQKLYSSIEEQNKQKFLDNQIEVDHMWRKPIWGVTLQIDLSPEVSDVLYNYQKDLDSLEPNNLLLQPRQYQHISFNQVIYWGGQYILGTEGTWKNIAGNFVWEFKKLDNIFPSFEITFSKLIATTGGIIWVAFDKHDEMKNLRNQLLQKLPFPKETKKFNNFIHTTVARYKNKLNSPQKVLKYIQQKNDPVPMLVSRLILRQELIFPSIKTKPVAQIELK